MTLIPVIALGTGMAFTFKDIARSRGLAEGLSEAKLVARTAVEPQLDPRPLSRGLTPREDDAMERLVRRAVLRKDVLRLRLRDLAGRVVFSDDHSGIGKRGDDDEALAAARGRYVARLTRLNSDGNDDGPEGVPAVEVYLPLALPGHSRPVGVLEVYLPYGPIADDVNAGLHALYRDLGLGLGGLFVVLFLITLSVSRGLRREVAVNAFLAHHDTLTGLPNRTLFVMRAQEAVARAGKTSRPVTLAILDLDHFKDINDTLGHSSGDELLTKLGLRLSAQLHQADTIARLGGDEFGVVLVGHSDSRPALMKLAETVTAEVQVRGLALSLAPSIGYVTVDHPGETVETLMQKADVAMYAAKAQHETVVEYSSGLNRYDATDVELISELRHAIDDGQLVLHYQPQTDVRSETIVAAEALVRWQHPVHGLLAPGRFLPMAEQTDLIERITEWVLATALRDCERLNRDGAPITISVNVSARSIVRADFADQVSAALRAGHLPADRLVIEVTETALLTDPERARSVLTELSRAGVKISVDDFGQGQTSLGYLANLPIDELKIDRCFVTGMCSDQAQAAIVRSLIELGHNLSMRVVAEGIESPDELAALRDLGCDLAQGYHLGRPIPAESLAEMLHAAGSAASTAA